MVEASLPNHTRTLRACMVCSLIKNFDQFLSEGCDNCEDFLEMRRNRRRVYDCTSVNFSGMIAMMQPDDSWVCRWQKITDYAKGMYAVSVRGELPRALIKRMKRHGIVYKSRDTGSRY